MPPRSNIRPAPLTRPPASQDKEQLVQLQAKIVAYLSEVGDMDLGNAMDDVQRRCEEMGALDTTWDNPPRRGSIAQFARDLVDPDNPRVIAHLLPAIRELEQSTGVLLPQWDPEMVVSL